MATDAMTGNAQQLIGLVHALGRSLDDKDYAKYFSLYARSGRYRIVTTTSELPEPMTWMDESRDDLEERLQSAPQHEWKIAQIQQTRLVSVDQVAFDSDGAFSSSSFALFHTESDGVTQVYVVGRYNDRWSMIDTDLLLIDRTVELRTRMLSTLSPLPI